jgi:hypothetical protein
MDVRFGIINQTKRPPRVDTDMMSNFPQDENIGESFCLFFTIYLSNGEIPVIITVEIR